LEGYDSIQELAQELIDVRHYTALCNDKVDELVGLWEKLSPHDKAKISYLPRYQTRLIEGRFKTHKSTTVTPGVDSIHRLEYFTICQLISIQCLNIQ